MQRRHRHNSRQAGLSALLPRRDLAAAITTDDMRGQLNRLALDGRSQDCVALMEELGDWQSNDGNGIATALSIPYLGASKEWARS